MICLSCSGPFFAPFLIPVVTSTEPGRCCLPFLVSRPKTFLEAMPLNLKVFWPVRFPGSAVMVGTFLFLRRKAELFFTHSQISSGDAMAGMGWEDDSECGGT